MDNVRSVKDGGSHRKSGRSPTKRFDFPFQVISSAELRNKVLQHVKKEKIDKLHEMLQGNNRERFQEIIEVVDETPKKGNQQERVQKVDHNLDKETIAKKMEIDKLSQPKVMKDHAHGDKEVVQETPKKRTQVKATVNRERIQKVDGKLDNHIAMKKAERPKLLQPQAKEVFAHGNKEVSQGMLKKRIHENLLENNRDKIQKVEKPIARRILISSKNKKPEKSTLSLDIMMSKAECSKKLNRVPKCPSMLIDDYVDLHKSKEMDATKSNNGEKPGSSVNRSSNQNQPKKGTRQESVQNRAKVNEEDAITNREEEKETSQRKTRGKTLCKKIHARTLEERVEVTYNEDFQPIGPSEKVVSDMSLFLGTLARNLTFCPLRYTNWSGMPDDNKNRFWRYTNRKFILSVEARDWIETTVREAWRLYKHKIKKNHFLKYSNMTERLKNRPPNVPIAQFKSLCAYWSKETIQAISENNTRNRAQLKWMHRMGPKNFALTREKVREKEKREPTQSEMFVETRKGNKGKELDVETGKVISQLQEMVEKEEKINALKQAHSEEVSTLRDEFQDKIDRLQNAFKTVIQQCNPQINIESIEDLLGLSHGDDNSSPKDIRPQMHSSTSTHAPCHGKQCINEDVEKDDINDEIQEDDINDKIQEEDLNDKIQEDDVDDEFQEDHIDLDDEFQEDDIDGEFQEDDVDEEFMEDDISNEFQEDDLDDLLLEDKLE
ncbi:unnamed protein product [Vicia faba]|uniref:Uncharacterized protein n=1 Tax=Vicia faba TaxID=3906 RepID=A0AAV0YZD9_VICFA|nr:unnamed protein product [Vicia faba]